MSVLNLTEDMGNYWKIVLVLIKQLSQELLI